AAPLTALVSAGQARRQEVRPPPPPPDTDLEPLPRQQPAVEGRLQPVQRVDAVEEVAAPAPAGDRRLIPLVVGDERLLLGPVGLEEEGAGLVEGAAQPLEEVAHAARGEPSTEGLRDPLAHLGRAPEAAGGDLLPEAVALGGGQS